MSVQKLDVLGFGLALGVTWGLGVLALGLLAWGADWGTALVTALGALYLGYTPDALGSVIGLAWAAVDGFIAGAVLAWIYNLVAVRRQD